MTEEGEGRTEAEVDADMQAFLDLYASPRPHPLAGAGHPCGKKPIPYGSKITNVIESL